MADDSGVAHDAGHDFPERLMLVEQMDEKSRSKRALHDGIVCQIATHHRIVKKK